MSTFEEKATLKMVRGEATTDTNGDAVILIKCPGIPGTEDGRTVDGGMGWCETPNAGDWVEIHVEDTDNLLGIDPTPSPPTIVESFTEIEAPSANQGWWISSAKKYMDIRSIAGRGFIPSGMYLKIIGHSDTGASGHVFRVNVKWGKRL